MSKSQLPAFKKSILRLSLGLVLAFAAARGVQAQSLMGTAQFTSVPNAGAYDYTITLQNTGDTAIGTFWFAWLPSPPYDYNFLPSNPSSAAAPAGWYGYALPGYYGGYSIDYYTYGAGLAPGDTATFTFTSMDSPAVLTSESPVYPGYGYLTATSYLYDTSGQIGASLVVTPAPEPASLALFALGGFGLLLARRNGIFSPRSQVSARRRPPNQ